MGHVVEAWRQFKGLADVRQVKLPNRKLPKHAFIHADGGVMSSHVSLILSRED